MSAAELARLVAIEFVPCSANISELRKIRACSSAMDFLSAQQKKINHIVLLFGGHNHIETRSVFCMLTSTGPIRYELRCLY